MGRNLKQINHSHFQAQDGRCFYCGQPMWLGDSSEFCKTYKMTKRQAKKHQSTVEHLIARCESGGDSASNTVSACRFCNETRHRAKNSMNPERYKEKVMCRMWRGRWHGFHVNDLPVV